MRLLGYEVIRFVTCSLGQYTKKVTSPVTFNLRHLSYKVIGKGGLHVLPLSIVILSFISTLCSCEDMKSVYSRREMVRCNFLVSSYTELFGVMGNYGQFASIRKMGTGMLKMTMASNGKYTEYRPDKLQQYFYYGLGGLIVGTNYNGEVLCYDLACPRCDASSFRLDMTDNGFAKCSHCGVTYDLNNYGVINSIDSTKNYTNLRGLYRYRIVFDGTNVSMFN